MFMISQCGLRICERKNQVNPNNIEHIYFGGYCLLKIFLKNHVVICILTPINVGH